MCSSDLTEFPRVRKRLRASDGVQKRAHVKTRLWWRVAELGANGTGAAREAAVLPAFRSRRASHVAHASIQFEGAVSKRLHRARGQTRLIGAEVAGRRARRRGGQGEPLTQGQSAPVCMPEAICLVDQQSEGARSNSTISSMIRECREAVPPGRPGASESDYTRFRL